MWIVKSKFSGKDGTYTITEESATNKKYADMKYTRQLSTWLERLTDDSLKGTKEKMLNIIKSTHEETFLKIFETIYDTFLLEEIQNNLKLINRDSKIKSTFEIEIYEVV